MDLRFGSSFRIRDSGFGIFNQHLLITKYPMISRTPCIEETRFALVCYIMKSVHCTFIFFEGKKPNVKIVILFLSQVCGYILMNHLQLCGSKTLGFIMSSTSRTSHIYTYKAPCPFLRDRPSITLQTNNAIKKKEYHFGKINFDILHFNILHFKTR